MAYTNDEKKIRVEKVLNGLENTARSCIKKKEWNKACAAIKVSARILYDYNQRYTDTKLENQITEIAAHYKVKYKNELTFEKQDNNIILFYDGFGFDVRGVARYHLNALVKNNYQVLYVTRKKCEDGLANLHAITEGKQVEWIYLDMESGKDYSHWIEDLLHVFIKYKPKAASFYTTPWDVAGAVAFAAYEGKGNRYLIDLTDHAFWLGVNSNDYFCGSREMSASNQFFKRGIPKEKLIKLGVNFDDVESDDDHSGLPFAVEESKYIFSGGSLYKTLGDPNNYFYKIIDHILSEHKEVKFLYAGRGDDSEMKKLINRYPSRVYLIPERKDFYYLIQHCILYLNTYPMFGGMMMKYAALAGKIPITLKHSSDSDGLLINQEASRIEYEDYQSLIDDVDQLLNDEEYLRSREKLLIGTVMTEERFVRNVKCAIENQQTDYKHDLTKEIDTSEFILEYLNRFDLSKEWVAFSRLDSCLLLDHPFLFVKIGIKKFVGKYFNR